jgi:hypothetical protein
MSTGTPGGSPARISRAESHPSRAPAVAAATLGAIGALEVLAVYLVLRGRLPSQVPWHFGVGGQPNGSAPVLLVLGLNLGVVLLVSAAFLGLQWWGTRSVPLARQFAGTLVRPLLVLQGIIVVGILPVVSGLLFAEAAGAVGTSDPGVEPLLVLVGALTAPVILVVLLIESRGRVGTVTAVASDPQPTPVPLAVGGPIEMKCSACGEAFRLSGIPLLAPHIGVGRTGSLYLRCPRCGERGWDQIVGRVAV